MPPFAADSVGPVGTRSHHFDEPLALASGRTLPGFDLVYETYGELNAARSNAILICHALSGHHHAAGYHTPDDKRPGDRKSTRLNSSHVAISYAVFCLKKKKRTREMYV